LSKRTTSTSRFETLWLTETVRLQDLANGVAASSNAAFDTLSIPSEEDDLEAWLLRRGDQIARSRGLDTQTQSWFHSARLLLGLLCILAIISGFGAAAGFFGNEIRTVNVIWTLIGLIGVHCVALLLWLFAGRLSGGTAGRLWFWAMGYWSRARQGRDFGADNKLARALMGLMNRNGLGQWGLSSITHTVWLLALLASLLTMLLALSLRSYSFVLETTILSSGVFSTFVNGFGYLPSLMGFAVPDQDMITAALSGDVAGQSEAARRAWTSWLCGALTVYAILPRALVWLVSVSRFSLLRSNLHLDLQEPGYAEFEQRRVVSRGIVDAAPIPQTAMHIAAAHSVHGQGNAVLALELGSALQWPPTGLSGENVDQLFEQVVESREQRRAVLHQLEQRPVQRLLVVCDARLSPDRGTLHFLVALSHHTAQLRVCLSIAPNGEQERVEVWRESLQGIGMTLDAIMTEQAGAFAWVAHRG
jgi:hypothetical protein